MEKPVRKVITRAARCTGMPARQLTQYMRIFNEKTESVMVAFVWQDITRLSMFNNMLSMRYRSVNRVIWHSSTQKGENFCLSNYYRSAINGRK